MAVAEIAARLDLPVSVVVILLSDLLEAGRITARLPHPVSRATEDLDLLQKVRGRPWPALSASPRRPRHPHAPPRPRR
ncbi:hypothetical protein STENM327S_02194 [Streptomyces tendae]